MLDQNNEKEFQRFYYAAIVLHAVLKSIILRNYSKFPNVMISLLEKKLLVVCCKILFTFRSDFSDCSLKADVSTSANHRFYTYGNEEVLY